MPSPSINHAPGNSTPPHGVWRWPLVVVALSLALSGTLTWSAWVGNTARDQSRFFNSVERTNAAIEARLELYISMLRAGAGLFTAKGEVSQEEFRAFATQIDLPTIYPGAQGIGFARQVPRAELEAFVEDVRRENRPDFEITPPGDRGVYFPIVFLEPRDRRNEHAVGYDMFSEPLRHAAMSRARDEGRAAATERVVLVQEIDPEKQAGFLIYVPVYRGRDAPETVEARRERLLGFVYSPFRAGDLLSGIMEVETMPRVHFDIYDGTEARAERLLYRSPTPPAEEPSFSRRTRLRVADRDWTVYYRTTPLFEAGSARSLTGWLAAMGLLVSIALGAITLALSKAVAQSQARGRELSNHREELRVTLSSIGDAVIATDEHGRVSFMNPVAEQLTEWSLSEAKDRRLDEIVPLLNEHTNLPVASPVEAVLRHGVTVELANHTVLISKSGLRVPIEDSAAPIRAADGSLAGVVLVFHDVGARRHAEDKLRATEERQRLAAEAANLGTWDYDLATGELHLDARCRRLMGVPEEAEVGYDLFVSLLHPEDRQPVREMVKSTFETGSSGGCEIECRTAANEHRGERWIRAAGRIYFGNELVPHAATVANAPPRSTGRFVGTVQDITERKRQEKTLKFLADLGLATQRIAEPEKIMETAARLLGQHLEVNRCAYAEVENESVFVITGDYLSGVTSIVGRWPVPAFGAECTRAMLANEPYIVTDTDADARIGPADLPAYRAASIRAVICVPLHKDGRFTAAMAVHQTRPRRWTRHEIDLVEMVVARCWESLERGRAIRGLRESEQRLRFMAESMPQKICTARPDGSVDYFNRQWLEFTGASLERLCEWGWVEFLHPEERDDNVRHWKRCVETGEPFQAEQRFRRHDGAYRWHLTRVQPMRDREGRVSMWIGSNTDITEIVQARETLAERREELERLVHERTASLREAIEQMEEFSYSISHDLRAPLRAMQGYAQALLEDHGDDLDPQAQGYLQRIINASARMDRLTQDVLTYSKVARAPVRPQRVSLEHLVTECIQQYVDARPTKADIRVESPLPDVCGHEALLMQTLSNLVGNALKFTAKDRTPRVRIRAERRDGEIRLWVEDNGIGILPEHQKRIWGMFEKVHPTSGHDGAGIGLAIVRKAVERMGGKAGVESDGRTGSRFWIQLPAPSEELVSTASGGAGFDEESYDEDRA